MGVTNHLLTGMILQVFACNSVDFSSHVIDQIQNAGVQKSPPNVWDPRHSMYGLLRGANVDKWTIQKKQKHISCYTHLYPVFSNFIYSLKSFLGSFTNNNQDFMEGFRSGFSSLKATDSRVGAGCFGQNADVLDLLGGSSQLYSKWLGSPPRIKNTPGASNIAICISEKEMGGYSIAMLVYQRVSHLDRPFGRGPTTRSLGDGTDHHGY